MAQTINSFPFWRKAGVLLSAILLVAAGLAYLTTSGTKARQACDSCDLQAAQTEVYNNNFESAVGNEWRNVQTNQIPATSVTPVGARRFLGEFLNNEIQLSLNNLPAHNRVSVVFDFYMIRSWDGNVGGPDIFQVKADGQNVIRTTFGGSPQSYPDQYPNGSYPFGTGSSEVDTLGYMFNGEPKDRVFQISQAVSHSSSSLQISFSANGLGPDISDESWGIDNVRVLVETIPNETVTTLMPYESAGYRYQILPPTQTPPVGFEQPSYDDSAWLVGQASFGYNDGCVFPFNVRTHWQTNTKLILRKSVAVPAGATNLRVNLSVDNDIQNVWFNGTLISRPIENSNCPLRDQYYFDIPQNLVQTGNNLIAYQVSDRGRQTFFDSRITSNIQIACNPPTNGLVSWYRAEDTANDSFGNNNGTLQNGATFAPGKIGQGFSFDGIDDFVLVPSSPSLQPTEGITVESWVRFNSFYTSTSCSGNFIVAKGHSNVHNTSGSYSLGAYIPGACNGTTGSEKAFFQLGFGGAGQIAVGSSLIETGPLYHFVGTYDGVSLKIYVNGVLEGIQPESRPLGTNNDSLSIGKYLYPIAPYNFNGVVDEVRIYSRALSATEINNIYQSSNNPICQLAATSKPFDFDGDGKADVSVFRPSNGAWYLLQSQAGFAGVQFGISTDKLAPADFDGDGKTDVAVFRNGIWYLQRSQAGFTSIPFGISGDVPVPADYDGDGKADIAVYRGGNWYILQSSNGQFRATQFGIATDKPVIGDFDGDGKSDLAVFRPENGAWYLLQSTAGFTGVQFGIATDKPVPADYDGDGKTDIAVFRNGIWYLLRSQAGFTSTQFGIPSDLPAPADFDGDGKADIAVFRDGNWYLQRSTAGFQAIPFGSIGDKPVPAAFVP